MDNIYVDGVEEVAVLAVMVVEAEVEADLVVMEVLAKLLLAGVMCMMIEMENGEITIMEIDVVEVEEDMAVMEEILIHLVMILVLVAEVDMEETEVQIVVEVVDMGNLQLEEIYMVEVVDILVEAVIILAEVVVMVMVEIGKKMGV